MLKRMHIVFILICIQLTVIIELFFYIKSEKNVLGDVSINPISKEAFVPNDFSELEYYFEPSSSSKITEISTPWLREEIIYSTNTDSLRESKEYSIEKHSNTYRIVTLGDSFTFGMFVNDKDNWTEQLEVLLNTRITCSNIASFEVINLGVAGYDIQYSVERFKIRGQKYNPDLVIWFLKDDDFLELNEFMRRNEKKHIDAMKKSGEYEKAIKEGNPYPYVKKLNEEMDKYRIEIGANQLFKMQQDYINELDKYYTNNLLFVTFPYIPEKYLLYFKELSLKRQNKHIAKISNIYENANQLTFSPHDFHPNAEGHRVIAEDVFRYLMENNFIPCESSSSQENPQ